MASWADFGAEIVSSGSCPERCQEAVRRGAGEAPGSCPQRSRGSTRKLSGSAGEAPGSCPERCRGSTKKLSAMHFLGSNVMLRSIPSFPDSFHSWNYLSSIGSGITFLSFSFLYDYLLILYCFVISFMALEQTPTTARSKRIKLKCSPSQSVARALVLSARSKTIIFWRVAKTGCDTDIFA